MCQNVLRTVEYKKEDKRLPLSSMNQSSRLARTRVFENKTRNIIWVGKIIIVHQKRRLSAGDGDSRSGL